MVEPISWLLVGGFVALAVATNKIYGADIEKSVSTIKVAKPNNKWDSLPFSWKCYIVICCVGTVVFTARSYLRFISMKYNKTNTICTSQIGRWANGVVPYVIDQSVQCGLKQLILSAIDEFHVKTPIVWREKGISDQHYVSFEQTDICGAVPSCLFEGKQLVELSYPDIGGSREKLRMVGVLHEMMHVLGFCMNIKEQMQVYIIMLVFIQIGITIINLPVINLDSMIINQ
eukprot:541947_1